MTWDLVIVTARTSRQRWLFERYLGELWPQPGASRSPVWTVLQDPPGPQLGTAGATLHALSLAAEKLGARLDQARVLVLHCGGLSQRVPQLAHVGKAFAPGSAGSSGSLFAQVVAEMDRLFAGMEPGAVIACGDILYTTTRLDAPWRRGEVAAVAYRSSAEQASRHGVYLWEPDRGTISDSWQKPPVSDLLGLSASWGLDTGILYFGSVPLQELLKSIGCAAASDPVAAFLRRKREWHGAELYRDLTPPMTRAWSAGRQLPGAPGEAQQALSRFPLRVVCPEPAQLLHFGTNEELLRILAAGGPSRVHASYAPAGQLGPGSVLDRCLTEEAVVVAAGSYVSGLNRPQDEIQVGPGRVAYQLPLRMRDAERGAEVFVALGTTDDPKRHPADGATFLGSSLEGYLRELRVSAAEVWPDICERARTLWNARLFPVGDSGTVAQNVPWLPDAAGLQLGPRVDRWRGSRRTSMADANRQFDARRWWAHEERIRARCFAAALAAAVQRSDGSGVGELVAANARTEARRIARRQLEALAAAETGSLTGARSWLVAAALSSPSAAPPLRERGFRALGRTLVARTAPQARDLRWRLPVGGFVEARAPVRVDLAGGWTDTPPQACELGGTVLNVALLLDGQRPITVRVERLAEPVLELAAEDLGVRATLLRSPSPGRRPDPRDPFGIHRAALRYIGLFGAEPLPERLRLLGGGIRLTTSAAVPKGSGLGTSSILGAALLAALGSAFGRERSLDDLCLDVLRLEQMMGTGGGWQDQVGGMWGGVKFAASAPGITQQPEVEPLALSPDREAAFAERMVLFYTGEPRLAKDVLQRVVGSYLVGHPGTLGALGEMPTLARRAKMALLTGDWNSLGRCISRSWELNRQLEPTTSNEQLDSLLTSIAPFVSGAKLAGAGGGGFLFALARDPEARKRLEDLLADRPAPARLFPTRLDRVGLQVACRDRPCPVGWGQQ